MEQISRIYLPQNDAAAQMSVEQGTVARWERGKGSLREHLPRGCGSLRPRRSTCRRRRRLPGTERRLFKVRRADRVPLEEQPGQRGRAQEEEAAAESEAVPEL